MGKRGHRYPQVEPGAVALVDAVIATAPPALSVRAAQAFALKEHADALRLGDRGFVLRADLARASAIGLDELPASAITRPLPLVAARAPEVTVRRELAAGAPMVVVQDRRGIVGGVSSTAALTGAIGLSVAARLSRALPAWASETLTALGRLAASHGMRAFLVGGVVRDVLHEGVLDRADLDIVVEGDGLALARALGEEQHASVIEHGRFLTASIRRPSGERVDVATARSERYESPGALPRVMPASIHLDLARRDFTLNAMAVEIGEGEGKGRPRETPCLGGFTGPSLPLPGAGMRLLDPHGGRADLRRRRLRILHPLSFVDDPTRIFRGARYAARLDLVYDGWTAACQAFALGLGGYPALSGPRIAAELERILADARPELALRRLGSAGAFRLLDHRYRFTRATGELIGTLPSALAWSRERGLDVARLELALTALLAEQPTDVRSAALRRLGFTGEPLTRAARALETSSALASGLAETPAGARRGRLLRERTDLELAALWLGGEAAARAAVTWWVDTARRVRPVLRGEEVVELGVRRGPAVAEVLDGLRDRRLDGGGGDREAEIEYVRHWLEARREG